MNSIGRVSNAKEAYDYIQGEILIDPSSHGSFINEQAVADEVGISRTPVREALRILASEGLVEQIPNRGTMIPIITRKQVNNIMDLRIMLEIFAATSVIKSEVRELPELHEIVDRQAELAAGQSPSDVREFVALDQKFHAAIIEASDNAELARVYARISIRQWMIGAKSLYKTTRWASVVDEHRAIVSAIESGNAAAVEEAVKEHLRETRDTLLAEYPR